jgi:site-specific DNA recombinase
VEDKKIRAVSYERVSTEKQADRSSILAQADELDRRLKTDGDRVFIRRYQDEAFSGALKLYDRPQGRQLLEDAARHMFEEVWVFKTDRLGRDDIDPLIVKRTLERYGIQLRSLYDNTNSQLEYAIKVAVGAEERRNTQIRTRAGMKAASSRGRYLGCPPPYGYRVEDRDGKPYLVPDDQQAVWGGLSSAAIAKRIFEFIGVEKRSARSVAHELNRMGVPTVYAMLSRGVRGKTTRNVWTPGRILQIVKSPTYIGKPTFGKRPNDKSSAGPVHHGTCPRLVSDELWQATQEVLQANRVMPRHPGCHFLLRGVIKCGICGLTFCAARGRPGVWWYRCGGYLAERGGKDYRCRAKSIKSTDIEAPVWNDIQRFLRDPGPILDELRAEQADKKAQAVLEAERITLEKALLSLDARHENALDMREHGRIDDGQLAQRLEKIDDERRAIEERIRALPAPQDHELLDPDLLQALQKRLEIGLTDQQRQQVAELLVKRITVFTEVDEMGRRTNRLAVEYRFFGVDLTGTGTGSLR